jgi:hypothetical protein
MTVMKRSICSILMVGGFLDGGSAWGFVMGMQDNAWRLVSERYLIPEIDQLWARAGINQSILLAVTGALLCCPPLAVFALRRAGKE